MKHKDRKAIEKERKVNEKERKAEQEEVIEGGQCCGKSMKLAPSGICFECEECGGWEHSSS